MRYGWLSHKCLIWLSQFQSAILSEASVQQEIQEEMMKFRDELGKSQMMIQQKERDLTKPIFEKVQKVIGEIAKEKDLSMIFEKSEQGALWAKPELDITDEVVKRADK